MGTKMTTIVRKVKKGVGVTSLEFDLVTSNDRVYRNVHKATAPEGILQDRWEAIRMSAFIGFSLITEARGEYNGKRWNILKNRDYYDVLTEDEITEIIVGQYHYDTCFRNPPLPKLSHPLRIKDE